MTGTDNADILLEEVYRGNLFLVETDIQSPPKSNLSIEPQFRDQIVLQASYRYHDLFAEFLRYKLNQQFPELIPELHLNAARALTDPSRAVRHYLAAEHWAEAAEIIEQIGAEMFTLGYMDTLSRWINSLPASVRESHPRLLHYLSSFAIWRGEWSEVQPLLERALQGFEAVGDEAGQGEILANLAIYALLDADMARSIELFDRSLNCATPPPIQVQSLLGRASVKLELGDWEQGEQDFNAAMALVERTGELDLLHLVNFPYFDTGFAFLPGGSEHLERIYFQARALVGDEISPLRLIIEEGITSLYLIGGHIDQAIRSAKTALALRDRLGGHPYLGMEPDIYLIMAYSIRGEYASITPLLDPVLDEIELSNTPTVDITYLLVELGRIYWLLGRVKKVREIYDLMCTIDDPRRDFPSARICRAWVLSMLEVAEDRYKEAERILLQPEVFEQKDRLSTASGSTRLMLARLYLLQNQQEEALAQLGPVLSHYEEWGIPIPILFEGQSIVPLLRLAVEKGIHSTYAAHLLEILGASDEDRPVFVPDTGETLTSREVEILRLVVAGYSNQEIADHLFISIWTVKSHLTKIYRKLDASSRSQAIARAHELWLE